MTTPTARVAPLDPSLDKAELRRSMRLRREACDPRLGSALTEHLLASGLFEPGDVIAGYWPLASEIDVRPVLRAAHARGHVIALPSTPAAGSPLAFARWRPGDPLHPGRFGTQEPGGELVVPRIVLVPLLAFDRAGRRLGYGGGYYDRTLAALGSDALAIGCGFAVQEVDRVPVGTHDRSMHAVATEAGVFLVE